MDPVRTLLHRIPDFQCSNWQPLYIAETDEKRNKKHIAYMDIIINRYPKLAERRKEKKTLFAQLTVMVSIEVKPTTPPEPYVTLKRWPSRR